MELLLTFHTARHVAGQAAGQPTDLSVDLVVHLSPSTTMAELAAAACPRLGAEVAALQLVRAGAWLDRDATVEQLALRNGDEIRVGSSTLGTRQPMLSPPADPVVSVDVIAGPDVGRFFLLAPGRYPVGHDPRAALAMTDQTLQRHHLSIEVNRAGLVYITPIDGVVSADLSRPASGGGPDGQTLATSTIVPPDAVVTAGATRFAVRPVPTASPHADGHGGVVGETAFHRTPYRPVTVHARSIEPIVDIPVAHEGRRFSLVVLLAPLVSGVAMALLSRNRMFLAMAALSPLLALYQWWDDRRTGGKAFKRQAAAFGAMVQERVAALEAARCDERRERREQAPDLADLHRRAYLKTRRLWERDRDASDVLRLRLGTGAVPSMIDVTISPRGDEVLRRMAVEALAGSDQIGDVPVTVSLATLGAVGIWSANAHVAESTMASLLLQVATLHSPDDVVVLAAVHPSRTSTLDWLKWLPHCRPATPPVERPLLVDDPADGDALLRRLRTVTRRETAWPKVVLVLDQRLVLDASLSAEVLDLAGSNGFSVLWLGDDETRLPRQCRAIVECRADRTAQLWFTDPGVHSVEFVLEPLSNVIATRAARALAPVRDAGAASAVADLPAIVTLFDMLGVTSLEASDVARGWESARGPSLSAPLGMDLSGRFRIDLVNDGPHALIAGTSGSGKTELLQTLVMSLAVHHSPKRLTFLFVDYKGGAGSADFATLPHTVGSVTNLRADLARRALVSLQAELQRRMRILEGRAKDLDDLVRIDPDNAPPRLVIVVDEFATLVTEVPEFVAGIVDIAQRGRSLGIHLVLATQRPAGAVNDNILANTNLRLGLRMLDASDSVSVLGVRDAADLPVPLRGRGYARTGARDIAPFQTAWAGAPVPMPHSTPTVRVERFGFATPVSEAVERATVEVLATQLQAAVAAVRDAYAGQPAPRRPWIDPLPEIVDLESLVALSSRPAGPGRTVTIGLTDRPELQRHDLAEVDLEGEGGLLVFGSGGSGRTTVLRTIAASVARQGTPEQVVLFGIDASGRGLRPITALPHTALVAGVDDAEATTRLLAHLAAELDVRRNLLSVLGAESFADLARLAHRTVPRIVLLIDGYSGIASAFDSSEHHHWLEVVQRIVVEGRSLGIHTIIANERRVGIPGPIVAAIAARLVLRMSDPESYADAGIPARAAQSLELEPGRGVLRRDELVQIAIVGGHGNAHTSAAFEVIGQQCGARHLRAIGPLPLPTSWEPPDTDINGSIVIGIADVTAEPLAVDLSVGDLTIAGPPGSGRTTTLVQVARSLVAAGTPVIAVGSERRPSELASVAGVVASGFDSASRRSIALLIAESPEPGIVHPTLVIDDADRLDDIEFSSAIEQALRGGWLRVVVAIDERVMHGYQSGWLGDLRRARSVVMLQPQSAGEVTAATGRRPLIRPGTTWPVGRGVLVSDRSATVFQAARPGQHGDRCRVAASCGEPLDGP